MENQFFVDSEHLSSEALAKKHRLENEPEYRTNHMEYIEGMEIIESDIYSKVIEQIKSYDYSKYTASDVKTALEHDVCTIEDFKALLSPAAKPFLEQMAQRARLETSILVILCISLLLYTLRITVRIIACIVDLTATIT